VGTLYKAWATACETANVAGRIFHDLRRTTARSGTPERVAVTVAGHETCDVFERYNIVSDPRPAQRRLAEHRPTPCRGRRRRDEAHDGAHKARKPALRLIEAGS